MSRRTRAGHVKTALREITRELVSKNQYSTANAVAELRKKHKKAIARDRDDIRDIGLKVLAGLIRSRPVGNSDQGDFAYEPGIREFETFVFRLEDGKLKQRVVNVLDFTLGDYYTRVTLVKKPRVEPNARTSSSKYFEEMRGKGLLGIALREYLSRRTDEK